MDSDCYICVESPELPAHWSLTPLIILEMAKYVCDLCGWEYDPEAGYPDGGIAPGTAWEDVPADFVCPLCGASKEEFSEA